MFILGGREMVPYRLFCLTYLLVSCSYFLLGALNMGQILKSINPYPFLYPQTAEEAFKSWIDLFPENGICCEGTVGHAHDCRREIAWNRYVSFRDQTHERILQ